MSSYESQYDSQKSRGNPVGNFFRNLSLIVTGSLMMAGLLVGFGLWRSGDKFLLDLLTLVQPAQPEPEVDVESIVVEQIRGASELTTAVFAMQAVVPTKRDRTFAGYVVGTTTLLYIAHGEVRAGVDLSQITRADVQMVDQTVLLRLPPPRILDSKIDVNRSGVYDYDRGFLGLGPDAAPELQSLAQRETLQTIVETACQQGLLQQANERAKLVVSQLLTTVGYQGFAVETQPPAANACQLPTTSVTSEITPVQTPTMPPSPAATVPESPPNFPSVPPENAPVFSSPN